MTQSIEITPEQALVAVLENWDRVDRAQIGRLANHMWRKWSARDGLSERKQNQLTASASLLASLELCKDLSENLPLDALRKLWRRVKDGENAGDFGGLIFGEDSPDYRRTLSFVEQLFYPHVQRLLSAAFEQLAQTAAQCTTVEARVGGFESATNTLDELFRDFDFETVDLEKDLANKQDLLMQLADAEQAPRRYAHALNFIHSVYRHRSKGAWMNVSESPLLAEVAERLARQVASDERVMASVENYPAVGLFDFGKGKASTGTVAYRSVTKMLREVSAK